MIAQINGIDLYYEKTGSGRPLLLVHGNGEDHTIFDVAIEELKEHFTCYAVDSRGHGQSTPVNELHYEDMSRDMMARMDHLDLHDVLFYGFSDGGIVGLLTASRCDRVTGLIVSGANVSPEGVSTMIRVLFRAIYLFKRDPKIKLMIKEPHITDDILKKIKIPTLVLAGEKDLILESETRHIADSIPRAVMKILPEEGHGSYIIHNRKIAQLILDFCTGS